MWASSVLHDVIGLHTWDAESGLSGLRWNVACRGLAAKYRMPMELAISLASLALYDIVIFCDDSGICICVPMPHHPKLCSEHVG